MPGADVRPVERAALITEKLMTGRGLTTAEAAELCGVSQRTAQRDLSDMSRVIAIYRHDDGVWRVLYDDKNEF